MIYTITFNPAVDYSMNFTRINTGTVNRSVSEYIGFGGKGINVSAVLAQLGVSSVALGFIAGFTGDELERGVRAMGVTTDFIHLPQGMTRINVKLHADEETEFNANGPDIGSEAVDELFAKTDKLTDGDMLVLAGSVPACLPRDIYEQLLSRLSGRNIRFVVDAEKDLLTAALKFRPYLIKPNVHELGGIFGKEISDIAEVERYASELGKMGAENVLVSMGGDGALLLDASGKTHFRPAFPGKVVNPVGAGDSMVAGFIAGAEKSPEYGLLLGTAAGGATAFSEGLAARSDIMRLVTAI